MSSCLSLPLTAVIQCYRIHYVQRLLKLEMIPCSGPLFIKRLRILTRKCTDLGVLYNVRVYTEASDTGFSERKVPWVKVRHTLFLTLRLELFPNSENM